MPRFNTFPIDLEGLAGPLAQGYTVKDNMEASRVAVAIAQIEGLPLLAGTGNPTKIPHIQYTRPWPDSFSLAFYPQGDWDGRRPTRHIALVKGA